MVKGLRQPGPQVWHPRAASDKLSVIKNTIYFKGWQIKNRNFKKLSFRQEYFYSGCKDIDLNV